jgi:hypothetical protein
VAIYSLGIRTTMPRGTGGSQACLEIRTTSTNRPRLMEFGLCVAVGGSIGIGGFGLGRPTAIGVGPSQLIPLLPETADDPPGTVRVALDWATPPTLPAQFLRRGGMVAVGMVGPLFCWSFPYGLAIPVSASLALFATVNQTQQVDVWMVVDE